MIKAPTRPIEERGQPITIQLNIAARAAIEDAAYADRLTLSEWMRRSAAYVIDSGVSLNAR